MGTTMNRQAYGKLIQGDLGYLLDREKTLERDHIEQVLRASMGLEYSCICEGEKRHPQCKVRVHSPLTSQSGRLDSEPTAPADGIGRCSICEEEGLVSIEKHAHSLDGRSIWR